MQVLIGLGQRLTARAGAVATRALRLAYPPQCLTCDADVATEGTLCPACWQITPFIAGLVCDGCGTPLPGADEGVAVLCDDCHHIARPWGRGRAVMIYDDKARQIVLGLKYRNRHDIAAPAGRWLTRTAAPLIRPDTLVAPVPLHWWRLFRRRYNQSATLSAALARATGLAHCPDLLVRRHHTGTQDGRTRDGRFANMAGAINAHPRRSGLLAGRHVLLVDDVMTSGATLAAAADACLAAGAQGVDVVVLTRVAREA
ncbi:MAG: putative amidophosphoribosyltransferase [Rhodobacteraceae bacterium HLUCCA12]|nr:MAG: putative amidophosphoribosyltransferase [Rhodobacteraceae bacterium HLUCCA12]